MPLIVIEVMPKPELLDPQGKAVLRAAERLDALSLSDVRVGKRFELTSSDDADDATLRAAAERLASELLANEVIEHVVAISIERSENQD